LFWNIVNLGDWIDMILKLHDLIGYLVYVWFYANKT